MWTALNSAAKNATRIASGVIEQLQDDEYEVCGIRQAPAPGGLGVAHANNNSWRVCGDEPTFIVLLPIAGAAA